MADSRIFYTNPDGSTERVSPTNPIPTTIVKPALVISGSSGQYMMAPAGATAAGNLNILSDTTGFLAFWAMPAIALGSGVGLLVASSIIAGDATNLASILDAAATAFTTPDGIDNPGVQVITDLTPFPQKVLWDETNRIKTIAMRLTGTGVAVAASLSVVRY